jgi:hypothetical protein
MRGVVFWCSMLHRDSRHRDYGRSTVMPQVEGMRTCIVLVLCVNEWMAVIDHQVL